MHEFNLTVDMPFANAIEVVREALMAEQLGMSVTSMSRRSFKNRMDKEIPPYRILGACNPKLADRVLDAEPDAGALLPCNLAVRAQNDDTTVVSFLDPVTIPDLARSDEPKAVGREAGAMLEQVATRLTGQ